MDQPYTSILSDEERAEIRAQRIAARKRKKQRRRRQLLLQYLPIAVLALIVLTVFTVWRVRTPKVPEGSALSDEAGAVVLEDLPVQEEPPEPVIYAASATSTTVPLTDSVSSSYAILVDLQSNAILAQKEANTVINPASMTKILTLLVAAEQITNLDDTFTMTLEITDYCYLNDCSVMGIDVGETLTLRELLYGVILPSGADASLAVAYYVSGSQEGFVELMNQKLEELGLSDTAHFTNCVGLYDPEHRCTVYDMAMILKAAMDNELCREILGTRTFQTSPTEQHPDGLLLSNWFLRRIEDKDTSDVEVIAAKTGYVTQSGSCAASCGQDSEGNLYLCVTGGAVSSWQAIYDHVTLYQNFCSQTSSE